MPFKSEKQRKWMWANEPEMAEEWEKKELAEVDEGKIVKITRNNLRQLVREALGTAPEGRTLRVTRRQLRKILKEALDVINAETGEVFEFGDDSRGEFIPDEAWPDLQKRLGIQAVSQDDDDVDDDDVYISDEDFWKLDKEVRGKRSSRHHAREKKRMDIGSLQARLDQWAADAGSEYKADNPGVDMQDVARDLAASAEYSFEPDEWQELIWHYGDGLEYSDYDNEEDLLIDIIADSIAG